MAPEYACPVAIFKCLSTWVGDKNEGKKAESNFLQTGFSIQRCMLFFLCMTSQCILILCKAYGQSFMFSAIRLDSTVVSFLFNILQPWRPARICILSPNLIRIPRTYHLVVRRQQLNGICSHGLGTSGLCHFLADQLSSERTKFFV